MNYKFKTVEEVVQKTQLLSKTILSSNSDNKIIKAFETIKCIILGKCICDLCNTWDKDVYIVFEFARCLFPSKLLQLIKSKHIKSDKWSYIQPLYEDLYNTLYEDINPKTDDIISLEGETESKCSYELSKDLINKTIEDIKKDNRKRYKENKKK